MSLKLSDLLTFIPNYQDITVVILEDYEDYERVEVHIYQGYRCGYQCKAYDLENDYHIDHIISDYGDKMIIFLRENE